jgi:hypothetical protein
MCLRMQGVHILADRILDFNTGKCLDTSLIQLICSSVEYWRAPTISSIKFDGVGSQLRIFTDQVQRQP